MKGLLAVLCLMVSGLAFAGTVTLSTEPCTRTMLCYNVPNDGGLTIDYISDAYTYRRLLISINGDTYDSGLWATDGNVSQTDFPLYDAAGNVIYLTISVATSTGPCVRSGRATACAKTVTLLGGSIQ